MLQLCSPHWSYPQCWISALPSLEMSILPFVLSQSMDRLTALLSYTLLSNLWTTEIYVSTFWWIRSPRPRCQRLNIWRGLPSAASGHSAAASSARERNYGLVRQKYKRGFQRSLKHFYWVIHEGKAFMVQSLLNALHSNTTFLEVAPKDKFWVDT